MINIQVTVAEAIAIANTASNDLHDRIVSALEMALGINQRRTVTVTGGMTLDNRIPCIKAIRLSTGWGLKESKEWTDNLVGGWKNDRWYPAATNTKQSITLTTPEAAENLLRDLAGLGCEGYLS
jgi:ribosomal protein L7/L12